VGLDVHAPSVAAAAIDGVTGVVVLSRLTQSFDHITSWLAERAGSGAAAPLLDGAQDEQVGVGRRRWG